MTRILIFLVICGWIFVPRIGAEEKSYKACVVVVSPSMDRVHADLPERISAQIKSNDILPLMVSASDLSNYSSASDVNKILIGKVDSLKKQTGLPIGLIGIGAFGGVAAMDAANDSSVDFLVLISSIGMDGKEYLADSMLEMFYNGSNYDVLSTIRKNIRRSIENLAAGKDEVSEELKFISEDNAMKRLIEFRIDKSLDKIKCPVILTHLRYDGIVYWYPNLTNIDKVLEKRGAYYKVISPPFVNQYFEKAEMIIPGYISIQYSPDYDPNYDLSVFNDIASLIIETLNN